MAFGQGNSQLQKALASPGPLALLVLPALATQSLLAPETPPRLTPATLLLRVPALLPQHPPAMPAPHARA
jgi:hypothetical protein